MDKINDWINKQAFGFQISKFVRKIWMEYIDKEKRKLMSRKQKRKSLKENFKLIETLNESLVKQLNQAEHALKVLKQDTMIWIQVLQFDFMVDHAYQVAKEESI